MNGTTSQGGQQINLGMIEEIIVFALKSPMRFLLNLELDITRLYPRHLVTLPTEIDFVATLDTSINMDVQDLALDHGLLSTAALAPIFFPDNLTLALTVRANSLESLNHRSHLSHHRLHSNTVAACARLDGAFFASSSVASWADYRFLQCQFRDLSAVDILEGNLVHMVNCACFLRTSISHATTEHTAKCAATTKELRKEVFGIHATCATSLLKAFLSILII
jgi:hypothetical protein